MLSCRTIFISDVHLGCKDCQADYLLRFLATSRAEKIFLLGDIVDFWSMQKQLHWPAAHNKVLQCLLQKAEQGVDVIYVPGNHDEALRLYKGKSFGNIQIALRASHTTAQGKKLLLIHGDELDKEICFGRFQSWLGDNLYDVLLFLNRWYNRVRRLCGGHYFSLAAYIKSRVPGALHAIARYRRAAIKKAKKGGYDGIVCGHIHHPELVIEDGIIYCNDGDWIDSCTALIEQGDGSLSLYHFSEQQHRLAVWPIQARENEKAA